MLTWEEEYDEYDNTIYVAGGVFTDECGAPEFHYRLRPVVREDQFRWDVSGTDDELIPKNALVDPTFATVEEAKAECQRTDDAWLDECVSVGAMREE